MSLSDLASLGSFVSGVAVLASLALLYFQIRQVNVQVLQTERNQRAILQQGRAARLVGTTLEAASSSSLANVLQTMTGSDPHPTPTECYQFFYWAVTIVQGFEDTYFQHRQGMLDDESFASTVGQMRLILSSRGFRAAWRVMRGARTADFREFVDQLAEQEATLPAADIFERWKTALDEERSLAPP